MSQVQNANPMKPGCWIDTGGYSPTEIDRRIVEILMDFDPEEGGKLEAELDALDFENDEDAAQISYEIAMDAIDALQNYAPDGYWIGFLDCSDAFGCWKGDDKE